MSLTPSRFVTIPLAATLTGFSSKAIERKIEDGHWLESRQYVRRAGRNLIDLKGYEAWAAGDTV